ncbi:hypothetical protein LWC34_29935 [Kibdelosporangium philippinense]|uniref:Uncharacterized protein n=1 Tax=Kibdelosporangium philippinense TaxID=211113 RepID=A0ABS8ZGT9_9PSEU|nr:hypothetical protein [Kibdelosporangium philippinense]MCE7007019.1 hypothetical protein [Kibdelosporangium philippinense]
MLAWTAAAQGTSYRAGVLLGAAAQIWPSVGFPLFGSQYFGAPLQQCETSVRCTLGDTGFDAAVHSGMAYTLDEAIAYALDEDPAATPPRR